MLLFERMIRLQTFNFVIRLWVEDDWGAPDRHFEGLAQSILMSAHGFENAKQLAENIISNHSSLNAVEVVDRNGNGTVVYKDWP